MQTGQVFTSRNKLEKKPVTYIFTGMVWDCHRGSHHKTFHLVEKYSPDEDIFVDAEWFNQREIRLVN